MGDLKQSGAVSEKTIDAALQRLAATFPHVAVSIGPGEDGFYPASVAWDADTGDIGSYLAYQTRFANGMDERTRAAHLAAFYSHQFSIVAVFLYLAAGITIDEDPRNVLIRFEAPEQPDPRMPPDVRRFHFRFFGAFLPVGENTADAFHDVFVSHMTPVIAGIKRHTGFSAAAQWRLAADSLAGAFLEVGRALDCESDAVDMAMKLVRRNESPLLSPDLRFETIEAVVDGKPIRRTFRLRGGCCLFYRTEEGRFCDSCVLLDADSKRARLRAFMEGTGHP